MNEDFVIQIVNDWAEFLVQTKSSLYKRLSAFFLTDLPEVVLPYPIKTIEEAVNSYVKALDSNGETEQANRLRNSLALLAQYNDNKTALVHALKEIEFRNTILSTIQGKRPT